MVMRDIFLETVEEYKLNFRPTIDKLVTEEKWKIVKDEFYPNHWVFENNVGVDGHLFVFQKC